jgi:hypothetical protein
MRAKVLELLVQCLLPPLRVFCREDGLQGQNVRASNLHLAPPLVGVLGKADFDEPQPFGPNYIDLTHPTNLPDCGACSRRVPPKLAQYRNDKNPAQCVQGLAEQGF